MAIPIILILAVLWVAFFTWPLVQRRLSGGGRDSLGSLRPRRNPLARVGGRSSSMPTLPAIAQRSIPASPFGTSGTAAAPAAGLPMSPIAQKRRRDAFLVLACAVLVTALLAVVTGSVIAIAVSVVTGALLAAYVVALVQIRRRAQERTATVHYLPQPLYSRPLVLHRSVSSSM
ncbi:MAG: hypothetical protein ABJC79_06125 [Acidimicrobiia bacterium]